MRLLHTSDWHIGRQFHNVSLLDDQQHVLEQIVTLIAQADVDALLIAGDIYDRSVPPAAAVALLDRVLERICCDLQVPVVMISGNHDSAERLHFGARQLQRSGLHIFASLRQLLEPLLLPAGPQDKTPAVAVYGIPYADPARVRDHFQVEVTTHDEAMAYLCRRIREHHRQSDYRDLPTVVLGHCFVAGGEGCESERPLSIGGADQVAADHFADFTYSALGHLHGRQFRGRPTTCYSGSILKYSFSEQHHHKSVNLVEIEPGLPPRVEPVPLQPVRDMRVLEGDLQTLLAQGQDDPGREDYLLIRLTDSHAILDVMGKLREVYPNVLHLERPGLHQGSVTGMAREQLKKGELAMFEDFFQQVSGQPLETEQQRLVAQILDELHHPERQPEREAD